MADVFFQSDTAGLLDNKNILFIGDSNIRALYKDCLWLLKCNTLIGISALKRRENETNIEFIFVTRCYCQIIEEVMNGIKSGTRKPPDVILMNSCLWDICRWGPNGVDEYKTNMNKLMKLATSCLPPSTLFIWATGLPTASLTSGGLIIKQLEFIQATLRIHVLEANHFTAKLVSSHGFDVLDFHHYMHYQTKRRSADGIHYLPPAMRFLTNLLLTHIALSWNIQLPLNVREEKLPLQLMIEKATNFEQKEIEPTLKKIGNIANRMSQQTKTVFPRNKKKTKGRQPQQAGSGFQPRGGINKRAPPPDPLFRDQRTSDLFEKDFRLVSFDDFSLSEDSFRQSYDPPEFDRPYDPFPPTYREESYEFPQSSEYYNNIREYSTQRHYPHQERHPYFDSYDFRERLNYIKTIQQRSPVQNFPIIRQVNFRPNIPQFQQNVGPTRNKYRTAAWAPYARNQFRR